MTNDNPPQFWWFVSAAGLFFGWFLLFLLDPDNTQGQSAMTVVTASASALFAGAAVLVRGSFGRRR